MAKGIKLKEPTRLFGGICGRVCGAIKTKGKGGAGDYSFLPFGGLGFGGTPGAPVLSDRC